MTLELLILLSLLLSAFFSGMEIAFLTSNKFRIEIDRKQGKLTGRILSHFVHQPSWFVASVLIGNNIVLVMYGMGMASLLEPWLEERFPVASRSDTLMLVSQTVISTGILLLTGEFIPKIIFRIRPNETLALFSFPMMFFYWLCYPLAYLLLKFSNAVFRLLFGINVSHQRPEFGRIDLIHLIGSLPDEASNQRQPASGLEIFEAALHFSKVKVRHCMIPRPDIVAVDLHTSIDEIKKLFATTHLTRILVYNQTLDNIIGYVHSFEMFKNPSDIRSILLPVTIFPEATPAFEVLRHFTREHRNVAVIVDEHGLTAGMVTVEDIMEEIFGEIQDEHDLNERTETQVAAEEYLFSASLEIDYLNQKYGFGIPVGEYETLAGFILHHLESIPSPGQQLTIQPFVITIQSVKGSRIETVTFRLKKD
jgi:CBS domain containing-hemolysin-like protein